MPRLPPLEVRLCKLNAAARLSHHLLARLVAPLLLLLLGAAWLLPVVLRPLLLLGGAWLLPVVLQPLLVLVLPRCGWLLLLLGLRLPATLRLRLVASAKRGAAAVTLSLLLRRLLGSCCRGCRRYRGSCWCRGITAEGVALQLPTAACRRLGRLLLLAAAQPARPASPSSASASAMLVGLLLEVGGSEERVL